jgi:GT2 family glycosyltransferase
VPVTVIANATSRGLPAAINQGLRAARGEYLVGVNNDVVVTDGGLGQLIALANAKGDFAVEHAETMREGEAKGDLRSIWVRGRETRAQRAKKTAELDTPKPPHARTSPRTTHVQSSTLVYMLY